MVAVKLSCQVPIKVVIMIRHCNTGVRCNSNPVRYHGIRSSVSVSSDSKLSIKCQISGGVFRTSPILDTYTYRVTTTCVRQSTGHET